MATNKVFGSGYGIDFGTTNSVVALCDKSGRSRALTTKDGRPYPSVVWFQLDGTVRVGQEAKRNLHGFSEVPGNHFVPSIKRRLGKGKTLHVLG